MYNYLLGLSNNYTSKIYLMKFSKALKGQYISTEALKVQINITSPTTLIYAVHLTVILIWRFCQPTKFKSLPILLFSPQVLINSKVEQAKLNVRQSVFLPISPNLMSAKCTTCTEY